MGNEDSAPGRGQRSLEIWRQIAAARSAVDEARGSGATPDPVEIARRFGVEDALFALSPLDLPSDEVPPAAAGAEPLTAADLPTDPECVVRSATGRVSLRVLRDNT